MALQGSEILPYSTQDRSHIQIVSWGTEFITSLRKSGEETKNKQDVGVPTQCFTCSVHAHVAEQIGSISPSIDEFYVHLLALRFSR